MWHSGYFESIKSKNFFKCKCFPRKNRFIKFIKPYDSSFCNIRFNEFKTFFRWFI